MASFHMQKIFLTLSFSICCKLACSQTFSIAQIDSLVSVIDTSIYKQRTIEGTVTTKPSFWKGSSTQTYYLDTALKRLAKVEVAQALYDKKKHLTSVELSTYYYNDSLVMVKTSRLNSFGYPEFKKTLSSGVYYYQDDTLILTKEIGYKHGGIGYPSSAKYYRDVLLKKVFPSDL